MLPMRYAATLTLLAIALVTGCRSQSTPLTNPFLTPDRVPPPSTQMLSPGAAQPYYPGETIPGTAPLAAGAPGYPQIPAVAAPSSTFVAPPGAAPPASAYPGGATYPGSTYPGSAYPTSPVTPAAPPLGGVTPAEYQAPVGTVKATAANGGAPAGAIAASASPDGFRPQGSQPRVEATSEPPSSSGFRPPSIGKQTAGGDSPNGRFGVGPKQEWLRGQLEFHPDGQWAINYMDEGPKDQIGGRVLIDNPQVLANLSPGEFVVVEGQLFGRQIDETSYMPAYRVSSVQRQRQ